MSLCRVCLNGDLKMYNMSDIKLQKEFALFTSWKLNNDVGMPTTVCYICVSQLRRCCRFFNIVTESTRTLTDLLHNGVEISTSYVKPVKSTLTITTQPQISLVDSDDAIALVEVEQEVVVVKEELDEDPIQIDGHRAEDKDPICIEEHTTVNINDTLVTNVKQGEVVVKEEPVDKEVLIEIEVEGLANDTDTFQDTQPEESEVIYCDVCNNICTLKNQVMKYLKNYTGDKVYTCKICKKDFNPASTQDSGTQEDKPYSCDLCNKTFTRIDHLKRHRLIHTGNKPYVCEICNKAFGQAGDKKRHLRVHTGEKPYSCKFCFKTFRFAGHSRLHMRTHTGEKPFVCKYCDKAFNVLGNLKQHLQNQHNVEGFEG